MSRQASMPFPGVFSPITYEQMFRDIPTADLIAELEISRWDALEAIGHPHSRAIHERAIDAIAKELERRQRLLAQHPNDPLAPAWPKRDDRLKERVQAVKDRWPIEVFVQQVLHAHLKPVANGEFLASCPLPGHEDSSPSFRVYPDGHAHCFGCGRGGDIIALTGIFFGYERFSDKLDLLESMSGIGRAA